MCNCSKVDVKFIKMYSDVLAPEKATKSSGGYDLRVNFGSGVKTNKLLESKISIDKPILNSQDGDFIYITPLERVKIGTGIKTQFSEDYVMVIHLRSSAGIKSYLRLLNGTGVIDADYTGEIGFFLENTSPYETIMIENNERIGQIIFQKVVNANFTEVTEFEETTRGESGFGSTGKF